MPVLPQWNTVQTLDAMGMPTGTDFQSEIAASPQGTTGVVLLSNTGTISLWFALFDATGQAMTAPVLLADNLASSSRPSMAVLADGRFVVTWQDFSDDTQGDVVFQIIGANGTPQGEPITAPVVNTDIQDAASVTALEGGGFVISWMDVSQGSPIFGEIRAIVYDSDGTALTGEIAVNIATTGSQTSADVCGLAGGGFVVAWSSSSSPAGQFVRVFDETGQALTGEIQVGSTSSQGAEVTALQDGGFAVVNVAGGIRVTVFDAAGQVVGGPTVLAGPHVPGSSFYAGDTADITTLASGDIAVAYRVADPNNPDLDYIRVTILDAAGQLTGLTADLPVGSSNAVAPSLTALPDGRLEVSWTQANVAQFVILDPRDGAVTLTGTTLSDQLVGTDLNDQIAGGAGADRLWGDDGRDTLRGENGADRLYGGTGDDTLIGGLGGDRLEGGDGFDTASYAGATRGVTASLNGAAGTYDALGDVFVSIENLTGTAFEDNLTGDGLANTLTGGDGADVLSGGNGDDVLIGGWGADQLFGGAGFDTASYRYATENVFVDLEGGLWPGEAVGDSFDSIERFLLSRLDDGFMGSSGADRAEGFDGDDVLVGRGGDDLLYGNNGQDDLYGDAGVDKLLGGAGDDEIRGGTEVDTLYGEPGDDTLLGEDGDDLLEGGAGADSHDGGAGFDVVSFRLSTAGVGVDLAGGVGSGDAAGDSFVSIERFLLSHHNDSFTGSSAGDRAEGLGGDDTLSGGGGIDYLLGGDGSDVLQGEADADKLYGGSGDDTLSGGAGKDLLYGDGGNDTLSGGSALELDHFVITTTAFGADTIVDFQNGYDKIRVIGVAGWDDFSDVSVAANGSGWAVVTFPDGSSITLQGVLAAEVDASDFLWG